MGTFYELVLIFGAVAAGGLLAERLRVPLLTVYLVTGLILGPAVSGLVAAHESFASLGSLGVSLFLFSIALGLDLRSFRNSGLPALTAGIAQIVVTAGLALAIGRIVDLQREELLLLVLALTISSTVVATKMLAERKEMDSLHGQLSIAVNILHDLLAVLVIVWFSSISSQSEGGMAARKFLSLMVGAAVLVGGYVIGGNAVLRLLHRTLRNTELQLIVVLTLAVGYAALASALGFSREIGAFVAGLTVAASPYKESVGSRLMPLRDFLLLFFFLDVGMRVDVKGLGEMVWAVGGLSFFVLVVKPLILLIILLSLGFSLRTSFRTSIILGQVSEFALLLAGAGVTAHWVSERFMILIAGTALVTLLLSPLLIWNMDALFPWVVPIFGRWGRREERVLQPLEEERCKPPDVICFGAGRYGFHLLRCLRDRGRSVLAVDFDPEVLRKCHNESIPAIYGDVDDEGLFDRLPLGEAKWVVCTIPSVEVARKIVSALKIREWHGHIAVTVLEEEHETALEKIGAHVILRPDLDGAELAAEALNDAADIRFWLPGWPVGFREVRFSAESCFVGRPLREVPVRSETGAIIVAISRGGRVIFDPPPETQLFPHDRVLLMGREEELERAEKLLQVRSEGGEPQHFEVARYKVTPHARVANKSLAESDFRNVFGVTVVGIERGGERIVAPRAQEILLPRDVIVVIGPRDRVIALPQKDAFFPVVA